MKGETVGMKKGNWAKSKTRFTISLVLRNTWSRKNTLHRAKFPYTDEALEDCNEHN